MSMPLLLGMGSSGHNRTNSKQKEDPQATRKTLDARDMQEYALVQSTFYSDVFHSSLVDMNECFVLGVLTVDSFLIFRGEDE